MRVAAREVRSVLTTFRPLVERVPSAAVRSELGSLGEYLGAVRDAEVSRTRLDKLVSSELVTGLAAERLVADIDGVTQTAQVQLRRALESSRYLKLVETMNNLVDDPPLTEAANRPAAEVMPALVRLDWRRLSRAYDAVRRTPSGPRLDLLLHETRKAAKRVRYSTEVVIPVVGRPAEKFAQAASELQTLLGSHHDSVEMRAVLRRLAAEGELSDAFVYGRLHAFEQEIAEQIERQLPDVWKRISARHRRWMT